MTPCTLGMEFQTAGDLIAISDAFAGAYTDIETGGMTFDGATKKLEARIKEICEVSKEIKPWEWV